MRGGSEEASGMQDKSLLREIVSLDRWTFIDHSKLPEGGPKSGLRRWCVGSLLPLIWLEPPELEEAM